MTQYSDLSVPSIEVIPATRDQSPILANLLELYVHDFSEFIPVNMGEDGRYGYASLPLYWKEPDRHPLFIRADGKLAGFCFVKRGSEISGNRDVWDMVEFFILRGYRRHGIGTLAAHEVWKQFAGPWEIRVMQANAPASLFWMRAITSFTGTAIPPAHFERSGKSWHLFSFHSQPASR